MNFDNVNLQIPGFTASESAFALKSVYEAISPLAKSVGLPDDELLKGIRSTEWPTLGKAVVGGIQHVVSVDNGANYAELWRQGGNWYGVTGIVEKGGVGEWDNISLIRGVTKGMPIQQVVPVFLKAVLSKSDCGCGGK